MGKRIDRKALIRGYKESAPAAGVYRIRNLATGRSLIGAAANAQGRLNRHRFELQTNSHPEVELQNDWNELGEASFEFTVLDRLEPQEDASVDVKEDLAALEEMWLQKLIDLGEAFYGGPQESEG